MPPIFEYQGFGYTAPRPARGSFDTAASAENLGDIAAMQANAVAITATYFMSSTTSSDIYEDPTRTETLAEVAQAVDDAHANGLSVLLKPHVDTVDNKPRTQIAPTDAAAWFADYKAMLLDYAQMAEAHGAEMLSLGTEIDGMAAATYRDYWLDIIASVRAVYSGDLTYGANWDGAAKVSFWDQVDLIGVDVYLPISAATTPSMADLIAGWTRVPADPYYRNILGGLSPIDYYQSIAEQAGKPLLITEVGYRSADGAAARPFDARPAAADPQEQADLFQAFFQAWSEAGDWFKGAFLWHWSPLAGPPAPTDYQTEGKPAAEIIRDWFSGNGTAAPAPVVDRMLLGGAGSDTLTGGIGNDTIDGGGSTGGDSLAGGSGDDTFIVRSPLDRIGEFGNDGADQILTVLSKYTLPGNVEALGFIGSGGFTGTGNYHANTITGAGGNDTLDGGIAADTLSGAAGDDLLLGGSGIDTLHGGDGNDILDGGVERDLLDGGAGFDTARFGAVTGAVRLDILGPGQWQAVLPNRNVQQLSDIEAGDAPGGITTAGSAADDRITGGAGADTLGGGEGKDSLAGGAGGDALDGGGGNDTLRGGGGGDSVAGGNGLDTASYTSSTAGVDIDLLTGTASGGDAAGDVLSDIENLFGSGYGDRLTGDALANRLAGLSGHDTLDGGDGNDTLDGGGGADRDMLLGGAGSDSLVGGGGNDTLTGGSDADIFFLAAMSGADRITDFETGVDYITLVRNVNGSGIVDGDSARSRLSDDGLGNAVLDLGGGNTALLAGHAVGDFSSNDFWFV